MCLLLLNLCVDFKTFARKAIRLFGPVTNADIENEARVISSVVENGGPSEYC